MLVNSQNLLAPPRPRNAAAIRTCALFAADVFATALAAALAFATWIAMEMPPLDVVYGHTLGYGVTWHGWSSLLMISLLLSYFAAKGQYTSRVPFWTELRAVLAIARKAQMLGTPAN